MPTILEKIVAHKQTEVLCAKQKQSQDWLQIQIDKRAQQDQYQPRPFVASLKQNLVLPSVIAEVKKASPSKGIICKNFDVQKIVNNYERYGATCISVLTDQRFFQGHPNNIAIAKQNCNLPVLRKDFIVDEYQIVESRYLNADCILLIAAILTVEQIITNYQLAKQLLMDVLIEVHNAEELDKILNADFGSYSVDLIGINNRNLHSFAVSLDNTIKLLPKINENITVVTESGINTLQDIMFMQEHGVNCFLIGEALMKQDNPGIALQTIVQG